MDRASRRDVVEVILVVAAIGIFLWFGRQAFPGVNVAFAVALLAILGYSHWQAREGWREIGFRRDTFWPTSRLLLPAVFIGCVLIWSTSIVLRELGFPMPRMGTNKIAPFVLFGIAQQYVMLGFIFKRVDRVGGSRVAPALTSLLFALLHLPNPLLTAVTFVWGIVCCLIYRRSPNLWANGLAHGLLSALLYYTLPRSVTGGLRVGMEYVASMSS
jgi:membrane protease YdiL (CAAX protease family)